VADCRDCEGTGLLHKRRKENDCAYVFKCMCIMGMHSPAAYPVWERRFVVGYDDLFSRDLDKNVSNEFKAFITRLSAAVKIDPQDQGMDGDCPF
jgi:hypothetical protein